MARFARRRKFSWRLGATPAVRGPMTRVVAEEASSIIFVSFPAAVIVSETGRVQLAIFHFVEVFRPCAFR